MVTAVTIRRKHPRKRKVHMYCRHSRHRGIATEGLKSQLEIIKEQLERAACMIITDPSKSKDVSLEDDLLENGNPMVI